MDKINYKQKYLKYKNKYLELKANTNNQVGAYAYAPGKYVFFISERMGPIVDTIGTTKIIKSLDNFTTSLGNCAKFIRIGATTSGADLTHQYDTIYTNQSSSSVISRETAKVAKTSYDVGSQVAKTSYDVGSQVAKTSYDVGSQVAKTSYDVGSQVAKTSYDVGSKVAKTSYDVGSQVAKTSYDVGSQVAKTTVDSGSKLFQNNTKNKGNQQGGEDDCEKLPIRINELGLRGFGSINDVNEDILQKYVSGLNKFQGSEKIGRIIVIEKTGTFGKVHLYSDYKVNYDGDNITIIKK